MDGLTIKISWEYALGIIGFLIAGPALVAWYANGRFTALETSMEWVKDTIKELKISSDNTAKPAFGAHSPINLNAMGEAWLSESGLKNYIDSEREFFIKACQAKRETNPYEVQKHVFQMFDQIELPADIDDKLKKFAFEKGTTMAILRRVGAIYLRNLCLEDFGMNREDIDKHDPEKKSVA